MLHEFKLPDVGEGIHEAEVLAIKVKEGDTVKEYQPIFDVETDKAVVEITSPVSGVVKQLLVKVGEVAKVGNVMITFDTASASGSAPAAAAEKPVEQKTVSASGSGNGKAAAALAEPAVKIAGGPALAAPATRRLARELGIEIRSVVGSGPAGRITKEDIRAYAEGVRGGIKSAVSSVASGSHSAGSARSSCFARPELPEMSEPLSREPLSAMPYVMPDFTKYGAVERQPLRSLRKKIAVNMTQSWTHVPHVAHFDEIDVTELEFYRRKYEEDVAEKGGRLTMTVLALKAIASALKKYPQFNSSLDEASGEIIYKKYFNIGVAVATERGLIVPVIKDADQKSIVELSIELADIAGKTRDGKIELDRLQGGTFTITNIGAIGGTGMMPMVNYPEVGIFGMARAKDQPVVLEGEIEIRTIMPVTLSFDHRVADGAEAAYFVRHVSQCLQDPFKLLLEV